MSPPISSLQNVSVVGSILKKKELVLHSLAWKGGVFNSFFFFIRRTDQTKVEIGSSSEFLPEKNMYLFLNIWRRLPIYSTQSTN